MFTIFQDVPGNSVVGCYTWTNIPTCCLVLLRSLPKRKTRERQIQFDIVPICKPFTMYQYLIKTALINV